MDKIKIEVKDIQKLELPDGYKLEKYQTIDEKIDNLQSEIDNFEKMKEPSDKELIDWAKNNHPYYELQSTIEWYRTDIIEWEKLKNKK